MSGGLREESPLTAFHLLLNPLRCFCTARKRKPLFAIYYGRCFVKGQAPSTLTACEDVFASLVISSNSFAHLVEPVFLLLKTLMNPYYRTSRCTC